MTGREGFIWGVLFMLVVVFTVWAAVFKAEGIKAVECVRDPRWTAAAAMQVEVTTDRRGRIVERSIGECTFFSFSGPVSAGTD